MAGIIALVLTKNLLSRAIALLEQWIHRFTLYNLIASIHASLSVIHFALTMHDDYIRALLVTRSGMPMPARLPPRRPTRPWLASTGPHRGSRTIVDL